ncbi:hypothetical protein GCM10023335_73230 [Streptomyces siamensis]|uniref:Uncharacterized protein n=1 Tax=Streptomyces siamensis TaxID=1274986 RepID=A0ABP9JIX3_9ACTN
MPNRDIPHAFMLDLCSRAQFDRPGPDPQRLGQQRCRLLSEPAGTEAAALDERYVEAVEALRKVPPGPIGAGETTACLEAVWHSSTPTTTGPY